MALQAIKSLGGVGIVTDAAPEDLVTNAWSDGRNVSFRRGKVVRSPVFKEVAQFSTASSPVALWAFGEESGSGLDKTYVFFSDGGISSVSSDGTLTDADASGITKQESLQKQTVCTLADVLYVNRKDLGIRRLLVTDSSFKVLENTGTPAWSCEVLRGYQDFLVALNVSKGSLNYGSMVKWSNAALAGQVPSDWDQTQNDDNISTLAGENTLAELDGDIVDGLALKSDFLIYGRTSVWAMTFTGNGTYPFTFRSLFNSGGILAVNCVTEVEGLHYVFGKTSLYIHDGVTMQQVTGVSDRVFAEKTAGSYDPSYVVHDALHQSVLFCYQTNMALGDYCDKAAVYNYVDKVWSFVDLPNSASSYYGSVVQYPNWADGPGRTWADDQVSGATWEDDLVYKEALLVPSASNTRGGTSYLTVYDDILNGVFSGASVQTLNNPAWLLRDGVQLGEGQIPLTTLLRYRTLIPRMSLEAEPSSTLLVTVGGKYEYTQETTWGEPISWVPSVRHRVDTRTTGRYLSMRFEIPSNVPFTFSGLDVEYVTAGRR